MLLARGEAAAFELTVRRSRVSSISTVSGRTIGALAFVAEQQPESLLATRAGPTEQAVVVVNAMAALHQHRSCPPSRPGDRITPDAAVRALPPRLLLLCLLLRSSWLTTGGQVGAAGLLYRRGGGTCGRVGGCGCWRSKGKASRTLVARPRITREQTLVALAAPSKSSKSASNSQFRSRWKATRSRRRAGIRPKFPQAPTSR